MQNLGMLQHPLHPSFPGLHPRQLWPSELQELESPFRPVQQRAGAINIAVLGRDAGLQPWCLLRATSQTQPAWKGREGKGHSR